MVTSLGLEKPQIYFFIYTRSKEYFNIRKPDYFQLIPSLSKKGDLSPKLKVGPIALLVTNVFAGKSDRPTYIPDAKPAIALLE